MRPIRKHKGVMMERVVVHGSSGHASDPSLGRNAIDGMHRVIAALMAHREELAKKSRDESFDVPELTMNLGKIVGGDSPNRICARCELHLDLRPLPGMDPNAIRAGLAAAVAEALGDTGLRGEVEALAAGVPPFELDAAAELVGYCRDLVGQDAAAVMFGTEAPYLAQLGMEVVVMGPGSIDVAHQPNENLTLGDLGQAADVYAGLLERYCVDA